MESQPDEYKLDFVNWWKGANPETVGDNKPINGFTWQESRDYCKSVGKDLPTDIQWDAAWRYNTQEDVKYRFNDGTWWPSEKSRAGVSTDIGSGKPRSYHRSMFSLHGFINVFERVLDNRNRLRGGTRFDPVRIDLDVAAHPVDDDVDYRLDEVGFRCAKSN